MNSYKVFFYWEGIRPSYISLCRETIYQNCKEFEIYELNKDNVRDFVDLPPEYDNIKKINHKTDYLKAKLIYKYGGFWIDADTIIIKDFSDWTKYFKDYDFIGTPGFFGAEKGSKRIKYWIQEMDKILKKGDFTWSELINPIIKGDKYKPFTPLTKEMTCPLWYDDDLYDFFKNIPLNRHITPDTKVCILFNECFPQSFKEMNKEDILKSNTLIGAIFREALNYAPELDKKGIPDNLEDVTLDRVANKVDEIINYLKGI